jgi:hypothetical protein
VIVFSPTFNLEEIFLKTLLNIFVLLLVTIFANQANAAFVDAYDVDNWNRSIDRGAINTKDAPVSIKLTSSNVAKDKNKGNRNQDFTIESVGNGIVTFDWSYRTTDTDGPKYDPFGWLLNGIFTKLTDDNGKKKQSGSFSAKVKVGDLFGFRANSFDSLLGAATTTITNFSAPSQVPVPAALWLIGAPLLGLFGRKRKVSAL